MLQLWIWLSRLICCLDLSLLNFFYPTTLLYCILLEYLLCEFGCSIARIFFYHSSPDFKITHIGIVGEKLLVFNSVTLWCKLDHLWDIGLPRAASSAFALPTIV
jgi:hypothetical protein